MASDAQFPATEDPYSPTEPDHGEAYLFLVLQAHQPFAPTARFGLRNMRSVSIGRTNRFKTRWDEAKRTLEVGVADSWMSAQHLELKQVLGRWLVADVGSRNGTLLNHAPLNSAALSDGDLLETGRTYFIFRQALPPAEEATPDLTSEQLVGPPGLFTLLPQLGRQFSALRSVATSNVSIIIEGETGTGKELIARAIHQLSGRSGHLVAVNCGAIPPTLIENEFFGHERSAFSGATDRRSGLLVAADRGTLFLDEVADLSMPSQASLLRALQERQVLPLGAVQPVAVDLRVCAATHRNLADRVARQEFREDLWARLRGFTVQLPRLRDRREDLGLLVSALLKRSAPHLSEIAFHRRSARVLFDYNWRQNIRELEKVLQTGVVLSKGEMIRPEHLRMAESGTQVAASSDTTASDETPEDHQLREQLIALLTEHRGNIAAVGRAIGKQPTQVRRWVQRFRIHLHQFRS